jgi:hypothetical protein
MAHFIHRSPASYRFCSYSQIQPRMIRTNGVIHSLLLIKKTLKMFHVEKLMFHVEKIKTAKGWLFPSNHLECSDCALHKRIIFKHLQGFWPNKLLKLPRYFPRACNSFFKVISNPHSGIRSFTRNLSTITVFSAQHNRSGSGADRIPTRCDSVLSGT